MLWLHGLGADGHDFEPIVPELGLAFPVRFVFPHAPVRPRDDQRRHGDARVVRHPRLRPPRAGGRRGHPRERGGRRPQLIDRELERGMSRRAHRARGLLAGRRHRAAHGAARAARRSPACSRCRRICRWPATLASERSAANAGMPIFMAHGTRRPGAAALARESSRRALEALGYAVDWHAYPMAHSVCVEEISAIGAWLAALAGDAAASARSSSKLSRTSPTSCPLRRTTARRTSRGPSRRRARPSSSACRTSAPTTKCVRW